MNTPTEAHYDPTENPVQPQTQWEPQAPALRSGDLFGQIDRLIKQKGRLQLSHDEGGGGMGYYYCATQAALNEDAK